MKSAIFLIKKVEFKNSIVPLVLLFQLLNVVTRPCMKNNSLVSCLYSTRRFYFLVSELFLLWKFLISIQTERAPNYVAYVCVVSQTSNFTAKHTRA